MATTWKVEWPRIYRHLVVVTHRIRFNDKWHPEEKGNESCVQLLTGKNHLRFL